MSQLPFPELPKTNEGRRICQVIKVKPEALEEYNHLNYFWGARGHGNGNSVATVVHAAVWPEVLAALRKAHVVDYSINYFAPLNLLIATMRYIGTDFDKDMEGIKESEATRRWWQMTDGMQESFIEGATGSDSGPGWWTPAEEVFRMEG